MKKEIIPIGELKLRLLSLAERGHRINHKNMTLFAGFHLNQNWSARGPVLKERLETLAVEGAVFQVLKDAGEPGGPIADWFVAFEYTAGPEIEP